MEKFFKFVAYTLFVAILATMIITALSSCRTTGYGCHGNSRTMTGEGMWKRGSRLN